MRKWICVVLAFISLYTSTSISYAADKAYIIEISGPIGPATVDYVQRSLSLAEKSHGTLFVINLNTPGGLANATRAINQTLISSPIPIVTYVNPAGARAASAGTFIVYASDIAAMAPGTSIGAATPVSLLPSLENGIKGVGRKTINDTAAYIKSLAQMHGRNAQWGEQAVLQAATLTANDAKKMHVINILAENYPALLKQLDGQKIMINDKSITLDTKNMTSVELKPDWRYKFLAFITDPNIIYILMLVAIYGLFFEFANPGLILPGVAGVIALLLVFYAFQLLPINYAGLTLILVGLLFLIFEIYVSSFGVIGMGGLIAFVLGSIMLFDMDDPHYHLAWSLIFVMSALTLAFFLMLFNLAVRSHKKAIITGREGLIGSEGVVISVMNQQTMVRVLGEIWNAHTPLLLNEGDSIKVIGIKGLTLEVLPLKQEEKKNDNRL